LISQPRSLGDRILHDHTFADLTESREVVLKGFCNEE